MLCRGTSKNPLTAQSPANEGSKPRTASAELLKSQHTNTARKREGRKKVTRTTLPQRTRAWHTCKSMPRQAPHLQKWSVETLSFRGVDALAPCRRVSGCFISDSLRWLSHRMAAHPTTISPSVLPRPIAGRVSRENSLSDVPCAFGGVRHAALRSPLHPTVGTGQLTASHRDNNVNNKVVEAV